MVSDVNMVEFRIKDCFVAGFHRTEPPVTINCASVFSQETVCLCLMIYAINYLEFKASYIQNAYITAPCQEKVWIIFGPKWGNNAGKKANILCSLYGLKSAGTSFCAHLADCMRNLGYETCLDGPDLWLNLMVRPDDHEKSYSCILCYVDDILVIFRDSMSVLEKLDGYFKLKYNSFGDPAIYLGYKLRKVTLENGVEA